MVNSGAFVYFEKRQAKDIWLFMCHSMVILIVVALLSLRSWAADPDIGRKPVKNIRLVHLLCRCIDKSSGTLSIYLQVERLSLEIPKRI